MDAHRFYLGTVSGQRSDLAALFLRGGLACCVPFYRAAIGTRNAAYNHARRPIHDAGVPVVSVGNLTTGGTGKTPVVAWIVRRLREFGWTPGIISRGYGSLDGAENDEKRLLDRLCPDVPHVQLRDRVAGARKAIKEHGCDILVLDDGFQHRRLKRQLDVVLIDAVNPWGYGCLLPRGLLREPPSSLRRADLVLVTRCDQIASADLRKLEDDIRRYTATDIVRSRFVASGLINSAGESMPLGRLRNQRAAAFCGIGNPEGFRRTIGAAALQGAGAGTSHRLKAHSRPGDLAACRVDNSSSTSDADRFPVSVHSLRVYPDHHHYREADLRDLAALAEESEAECLITTAKDLVKIPRTELSGLPLWAVQIDFQMENETVLMERLQHLSAAPRRAVA